MVSPLKAMAVSLQAQGCRQVDGLRVHLFQAAVIFYSSKPVTKNFREKFLTTLCVGPEGVTATDGKSQKNFARPE